MIFDKLIQYLFYLLNAKKHKFLLSFDNFKNSNFSNYHLLKLVDKKKEILKSKNLSDDIKKIYDSFDEIKLEDEEEDLVYEDETDSLILDEITAKEGKDKVELLNFDKIHSDHQVYDPVRIYLKEIGQIPLLTFEEEQKQCQLVYAGRSAKAKLESHYKKEIILSEKEIEYLNDILQKSNNAKHKLVESNYRLVVSIAKRYIRRGLEFLDLIQEGNRGLMRAIDKFEPSKGCRVSTYSTFWVVQRILRAVADQARIIRLPVHIVDRINIISMAKSKLRIKLNREPTIPELSEYMNISEKKLRIIEIIKKKPISLEARIGEKDDSSLGEFISDPEALSPHDYMLQEIMKNTLNEILEDTLTDREEKILRMRYGLLNGRVHTLEEIGNAFGVTRERIRQIEAKAFRRLRTPAKQNKLKILYNKMNKK